MSKSPRKPPPGYAAERKRYRAQLEAWRAKAEKHAKRTNLCAQSAELSSSGWSFAMPIGFEQARSIRALTKVEGNVIHVDFRPVCSACEGGGEVPSGEVDEDGDELPPKGCEDCGGTGRDDS